MALLSRARPTADGWVGLGLIAGLAALAAVRIGLDGWASVAPDDARYLYVGLSILHGHGPLDPSGSVYLARSPVYGLLLASGSVLLGGDPLEGARLVALVLAVFGLGVAIRLGWMLAGVGGAVGTAIALVATALVWRLAPSMRIDLAQTAAIVATLWAVWQPTARRWALGGVLLGVSILIKETALPLVILPVALAGFVPTPRVIRLGAVFLGATIATAAWWWIVVWLSSGQVFPLNALAILEARDVAVPLRIGRSAAPLLVAVIGGWSLVAWRARRAAGPRLLLVAGAGLVPAAVYAASLGLNARNYAGLAVLSAVAIGAAGSWAVDALRSEARTEPKGQRRGAAVIALLAVAVFAVAAPVVGQRDTGRVVPDHLSDDLAGWLAANVADGGRVVMAFREREAMALRRFGKGEVDLLPVTRVRATDPLEGYVWVGLRDRQLFGYTRAGWTAALVDPAADVLVLVGPHPFTPSDLDSDTGRAARLGLTLAAALDEGTDHVAIYRVDPGAAIAGTPDVPTSLSVDAANAWLDLVGSDGAPRFVAARPVVTGPVDAIGDLVGRLGGAACVVPDVAGSVRVEPAGSCPD